MKSLDTKNLALALLEITDGKTEGESKKAVTDFVKYLVKTGNLKDSDKIISEYRNLYNKKHDIVEVTVSLINRLPEETRIQLRETLKKKYKAKEVHVLEKVDQRIIGGMKIRVGDTVYDSSIANSLKQLQAQLLK